MRNKANQTFEALPHVHEIWMTEDGNFHLHPHYGGEKFSREEPKKIEEPKKAEIKGIKK